MEEYIQRCKKLTEAQNTNWIGISNQLAISNLIKAYKEDEKIIKLMSEQLTTPVNSSEWVIDYYRKKVKDEQTPKEKRME